MKITKFFALALCIALLLAAFSFPSLAESESITLTVHYTDGKTIISGASFSVYLIATADSGGEYKPIDSFKDYPVDFTAKTELDMYHLATTLEGFVIADRLPPIFKGTTNENGEFIFVTDSKATPKGLYLIVGEKHVQGDFCYTSEAFAIYLPAIDDEGKTHYDVTVQAKFSAIHKNSPPTSRKVCKIWDDENAEDNRPDDIRVTLYKDGEIYETVTLSNENNWSHEWFNLDSKARWSIIENDEYENYTVVLTREGATYYFKNSYKETPPPPPDLPQTGQLWWPVPLLLLLGVAFITVGTVVCLKKKKIEN